MQGFPLLRVPCGLFLHQACHGFDQVFYGILLHAHPPVPPNQACLSADSFTCAVCRSLPIASVRSVIAGNSIATLIGFPLIRATFNLAGPNLTVQQGKQKKAASFLKPPIIKAMLPRCSVITRWDVFAVRLVIAIHFSVTVIVWSVWRNKDLSTSTL